jgi:hypothetical protein
MFTLSLCLLAGCGKRLSGVYEGTMVPPASVGNDAQARQRVEESLKKQNETIGLYLEFDGGEVKFGTKAGSKSGRYELKGDQLALKFDGGKTTVPMVMKADGSISYMTFVFKKK